MENKYASLKKSLIFLLVGAFIFLAVAPKEIFKEPSFIGEVFAVVRIVSGIPPTFDFNLSNYTIYQNDTFYLDINCSDVELLDTELLYYDNFTGFDINETTGVINQTGFNNSVVGNNTINISCSDGTVNGSQTFVLTILNINDPPELLPIGPQVAVEGELFELDIDATDIDNTELIFNASTTLFSINSTTGLVNFTPTLAQVGDYTINFSVFDGEFYDFEIVSFRIVRAPYCGDGSCGSGEKCGNCPADCGSCPELPPPEEEEEEEQAPTTGTGGGTPNTRPQDQIASSPPPFYRCDEKWECSEWGVCSIEGTRARKCKDVNKCNSRNRKPAETGECEYVPTCFDKIENGDEDGVDCGGPCEPCLIANCFDSIQNQNETGVDCGGPCKACEQRLAAKIPFIELPGVFKIPRQFPWMLAVLMAIVAISAITYDQMHMRKIRKYKFAEYREELLKFRPKRKKIYKFAVNIPLVTSIICMHIYYFSQDFGRMMMFLWVPITLMISIPIGVMYCYKLFSFNEYRKKSVEEMFRQTHKRELLQLISVENKVLVGMELKVKNQIYNLALHHKFDSLPALYKEINPVYATISSIEKNRREKVHISRVSPLVFQKMLNLLESRELKKMAKEYPEFMSVLKCLSDIKENINLDTSDYEQMFMHDMKLISMPQMKVVAQATESSARLYNELVELYDLLNEKYNASEKKDDEIIKIERAFADKFKEIGKKSSLLDEIAKNTEYANVYNTLMDLFNHYMRKAELFGKVKGL